MYSTKFPCIVLYILFVGAFDVYLIQISFDFLQR